MTFYVFFLTVIVSLYVRWRIMLPHSFTVASQILIIALSRLFQPLFFQLHYYQLALLMQRVPFITLCGFAQTHLCLLMYTCSDVCRLLFYGCRFTPQSNVESSNTFHFIVSSLMIYMFETVNAICPNNEIKKKIHSPTVWSCF